MAKGFLSNTEGDLLIEDGVFAIGDDDNRNMELIATNNQGAIGLSPFLGAGFRALPNARFETVRNRINALKYMLAIDKWRGVRVDYNDGDITIDGNR